jgi:dienelactone hydrolase
MRFGGRPARAVIAATTAAVLVVPAGGALSPARASVIGRVLSPATARVVSLPPRPPTADTRVDGRVGDWRGRLSHLAGTAHYDRGEWIYEDYPESAYGAALPGMTQVLTALGLVAGAVPSAQRLPGAISFVQAPAGAGPLTADADLSQLRVTVRGSRLFVLARTTSMRAPARTALLLLFDVDGDDVTRAVPFGSGLRTQAEVAALVTPHGTRLVDLRSGHVTRAPARADPAGYLNALETRLPLRAVARHRAIRMVAAVGMVGSGFDLVPNGQAGPLAKVAPRLHEPVQAVYDRGQAVALANHDIDRFLTRIAVSRLRAGTSERLLPGVGYNVRTVPGERRLSREGGTQGLLRQYGLYLPRHFSWGRKMPATVMLRGSSMTAHSFGAISPNLFRQLGDDNYAAVISPGGRSGFDLFEGATYRDVNADIADAQALLPIDRDRLTVAGYSMGGYGAYMFAATQPDRFAAAFVIEGPVGGAQPSTATMGMPDVVASLTNLRAVPIEIYQGDVDANVPATNALAAVERLRALGYRYRLDVFPAHTHFTHGIVDDYTIGARLLAGARRDTHPAMVSFTRNMAYEHAVDTGGHSDLGTGGKSAGLHFDDAWFVHNLRARDPRDGIARVDVRSFARLLRPVRAVQTAGVEPPSPEGELPTLYLAQRWRLGDPVGEVRNAFRADLLGASHVMLDLDGMGLRVEHRMAATVRTDGPASVTLRAGRTVCRVHFASRGTHHVALPPTLGSCPA